MPRQPLAASGKGNMPVAFFSGALGSGELLVVFLAILILFGPKRLPEIARTLGRIINEIQRASREFQDQIMHIEAEPRRPLETPAPPGQRPAAAASATPDAASPALPPPAGSASVPPDPSTEGDADGLAG